MRLKIKIIISFLLIAVNYNYSQTADVIKGCLPLKVNFNSPSLNSYYWDFKDGGTTTETNPNHIFTKPGSYTVSLNEGKDGRLVGTILITVYPDPIISFTAKPTSGCSPLRVAFTSSIVIDTAIKVVDILWSFGDGNSSTLLNPTHIYTNPGLYPVSLKITTTIEECNKTELVQDFIDVKGISASFTISKPIGCEVPSIITITNNTIQNSKHTYSWNFGNGSTFNGFDPKLITYTSKGEFLVTLTVKDESGCESKLSKKVIIGSPIITLDGNDSFCLNAVINLNNTTEAESFLWTFKNNASASSSTKRNPLVSYFTKGIKTITLTASNGPCKTDTSFNIFIQELDTNFTISPSNCTKDIPIKLEAAEKGDHTYIWNDSIHGKDILNYIYSSPLRDSFYRFNSDTIYQSIEIISSLGCVARGRKLFTHERPNAIMVPDHKEGCAPLTVSFSDISESKEKIIKWTLFYGDGSSNSVNSMNLGNHTYTKPGEYYVKLIIENEKGCIDTSEGFWIYVGEKINPTFSLDKNTICIGERITITKTINDPRIDSWHVSTDNGRFSHCWTSDIATHQFVNDVGTFPVIVSSEYNGCFSHSNEQQTITVKGAKAIMTHMNNCARPYEVMFTSKSQNATTLKWNLGDTTINDIDSFIHTYKQRNRYTVTLSAEDKQSGCPANIDTRIIFIKEIKADLNIPEKACDNVKYVLDAQASVDVDRDCSKGFLYILPNKRPRENNKDTIHHSFSIPGRQKVSLIVEDINGCRDTTTKEITVYSITPDFEVDKKLVCIPVDLTFKDKSKADTIIVSWDWSFGSKQQNPFYKLTDQDSNGITLKITDINGCKDSIFKAISLYKPFTKIQYSKGTALCIGDTVQFNAFDYTAGGSNLSFDWDFGPYGKSNLQNPKIHFDKPGRFSIILNYKEISSTCKGSDTLKFAIIDPPVAAFDVALDTPLCYPQIFEFKNKSRVDSTVIYFWTFDGKNSNRLADPTFAFSKGTHKVNLLVQSIFGCSSSIEKEFTLIGPEGKIAVDKDTICRGEEGTFSAIDLVDVNTFEWEFNDGKNNFPNTNKVKYRFDSTGNRSVFLILKSTESGCEHIDSASIFVPNVIADFTNVDSLSYCPGLAIFKNTSTGSDKFEWNFGEGLTSNSKDSIIHIKYKNLGKKSITLTAIDSRSTCRNVITKEINLEDVIEFYKFPNVFSPNGDGENDFFNVAIKPSYEQFITVTQFKVYNRWGKLIYNNENPSQGWNGKFEDVEAPVEVYAYYIEIQIRDCNNQTSKGNVTIVR
ncbi:MAG: PKD domain-containing protein [Saprospiraceae bacterium]|nr:PKD domain-containing protein [Saprospiraceae bacterium]